jgi:hypothetical protein
MEFHPHPAHPSVLLAVADQHLDAYDSADLVADLLRRLDDGAPTRSSSTAVTWGTSRRLRCARWSGCTSGSRRTAGRCTSSGCSRRCGACWG